MPSCAEFGFIDQYLSLRDQMDIEEQQTFFDLDQKVPQFVGERTPAVQVDPPITIKTESPLNFLEMEQYNLPVPFSTQAELPSTSLATPMTSVPTHTPTTYSNTGCKSFVAEAAGSGCTIIEQPQFPDDQQVGNCSPPPDLFNLDAQSHTFYCDDDSSDGDKTPGIKYELEQFWLRRRKEEAERNVIAMENAIIGQIRRDIEDDCTKLLCSNDPSTWTQEQVRNWVFYMMKKNPEYSHLIDECVDYFLLPGKVFSKMVERDFRWRTFEAGTYLFQTKETWMMTFKLTGPFEPRHADVHTFRNPNPQAPVPSISPAPSVGSTCSTMSSSSGGHHPNDSLDDDVFSRNFTKPSAASQHRPSPAAPREHPGPRQPKQTIHLWQFLRELLDDPESYHCCIRWTDRTRGVFKIEDSSKVAKLWGRRKNRPAMNYDKLSRSVRQYYKKGIIKKTEQSKRLVYQFCQPYL